MSTNDAPLMIRGLEPVAFRVAPAAMTTASPVVRRRVRVQRQFRSHNKPGDRVEIEGGGDGDGGGGLGGACGGANGEGGGGDGDGGDGTG